MQLCGVNAFAHHLIYIAAARQATGEGEQEDGIGAKGTEQREIDTDSQANQLMACKFATANAAASLTVASHKAKAGCSSSGGNFPSKWRA